MMANLSRRGERFAREAAHRKAREVAAELRTMLGRASVDVEGERILVSGRGIVKRWLTDPGLRFLSRGAR